MGGKTAKIEVCRCDRCGSEAEMTVSCETIEVMSPSGAIKEKLHETHICKACGNEEDLLIDFECFSF